MSDSNSDPFDYSHTDIPNPQGGTSPDFWRNLMMFGGNLATAANARGPGGFLTYGGGFAGPFGAALQGAAQQNLDAGKTRAGIGLVGAQTQGVNIENLLKSYQLPMLQARTKMLENPAFMHQLFGPMPGDSGADTSGGAPAPAPQSSAQPAPSGLPTLASATSQAESGNNPSIANAQGFIGKYQFGKPALAAAGVYQPAPKEDLTAQSSPADWKGTFNIPGRPQPLNYDQFLHDPGAQDAAWEAHAANLAQEIKTRGLDKYAGQTVAGVPISQDSLMAMMHGGGPTGTQKFLESGGAYNPADANGKTIADFGRGVPPGGFQVAQAGNGPVPMPGAPAAPQTIQPQQALQKPVALPTGMGPDVARQRAAQFMQRAMAAQMMGFDATPYTQQAQQMTDYANKYDLQQSNPESFRGPGSGRVGPSGVLQAPIERQILGPDNREYTITQNAMETGQPYVRPGLVPDWAPPGTLTIVPSKLAPGEEEGQKEAAQDAFGEKSRGQYASAVGTIRSMEDIEQQMDHLNTNGPGWYNTGAGANWRLEFGKAVNAAAQATGAPPLFDPDKLASGEDILKMSKLAGMQTLSAFFGGQREAASIVQSTQQAVPNLENTPLGGKLVLNGIKEAARWQADQHAFMTNWYSEHKGNMIGADVAFNQSRPSPMYARRGISMVRPYEVAGDDPKEINRFLPGTHFIVKADPTHTVRVVPGDPDVGLTGAQAPQQ